MTSSITLAATLHKLTKGISLQRSHHLGRIGRAIYTITGLATRTGFILVELEEHSDCTRLA